MVGPPISIFSIAIGRSQSARATVCSNGYRFTTTRSIGGILFAAITASSIPRRARIPPCIFGCRVLTRPSIISGKPVKSETSMTGIPASASNFAVPPVDSISTPRVCNCRANSTIPDLSETLISARCILFIESFDVYSNRPWWERVAVQIRLRTGFFMATKSTEEHGKISCKFFIFSCSSVDSMAIFVFVTV